MFVCARRTVLNNVHVFLLELGSVLQPQRCTWMPEILTWPAESISALRPELFFLLIKFARFTKSVISDQLSKSSLDLIQRGSPWIGQLSHQSSKSHQFSGGMDSCRLATHLKCFVLPTLVEQTLQTRLHPSVYAFRIPCYFPVIRSGLQTCHQPLEPLIQSLRETVRRHSIW